MKVEVKLGEPLWRQVGEKNLKIELDEGTTVGALLDRLLQIHPELSDFLEHEEVPISVFLRDEIADRDTSLKEGDCTQLVWAITGGGRES